MNMAMYAPRINGARLPVRSEANAVMRDKMHAVM